MDTAFLVLAIVQAVISAVIIGLVLMQRGKGADAGASFGAGASGTVFGARGSANFLSRATAIMATLFFANCLALAYLTTQQSAAGGSVVQAEADPAAEVLETVDGALDEAVDAVIEDGEQALDDIPALEGAVDDAIDEVPVLDETPVDSSGDSAADEAEDGP
ncbi:MAG: preprotein translocase subunit SecG [Pseudomonadota bacterium]